MQLHQGQPFLFQAGAVVAHPLLGTHRLKVKWIKIVVCAVWLLITATGVWALSRYKSVPANLGEPPRAWPVGSHVALPPDRPALLMFVHPHCPCSRASLEELNRLLTQCPEMAAVHVLFVCPPGLSSKWTHSDLWRSAESIPGVSVALDMNGSEAKRFGAESSGTVVVYGRQGNLLFVGGITAARGHAGDNAGENVIVALLSGRAASLERTPVFGCDLMDDSGPAE